MFGAGVCESIARGVLQAALIIFAAAGRGNRIGEPEKTADAARTCDETKAEGLM